MPEHSLCSLFFVVLIAARQCCTLFCMSSAFFFLVGERLISIRRDILHHHGVSMLQSRFIVLAQNLVISCDGLLRMWLGVRHNLCASQVVFDIWHAHAWSSHKLHNSNLWDRQRKNNLTSFGLALGSLHKRRRLLVLFPAWSPLPLIHSQVVLQVSLL